jgi:putative uncharacterized protein (fragment)
MQRIRKEYRYNGEKVMADLLNKNAREAVEARGQKPGLSKEALEDEYRKLEAEGFPDGNRIRFISALGNSGEIAYHYQLICKDWEEETQLFLENSFDCHGEEGLKFLWEKLCEMNEQEKRKRAFTAYLMAVCLSKLKHRTFYTSYCDCLAAFLTELLEKEGEAFLRAKMIIALGWVGASKEIEVLIKQMHSDSDALCRAWSATSLMQMSFHRVNKAVLQEGTKAAFAGVISEEKDSYACGLILESVQTIFGKKWITSSAIENIELEKIEKAKKSALRFLYTK